MNQEVAFNSFRREAIQREKSLAVAGMISRFRMVLNGLAKYIQVSGDTRIAKRMKAWEVLRFMWDSSGAPSKCIVSASENSKMVEEERAQENQMRQAALAEQLARAGRDSAAASAQFNTDS